MSVTIKPAPIRKTLVVRATPQRAFDIFTAGFDRWWPKTHFIGPSPLKKAVIEPGVGGRWYGLHEDGSERLWGDVLAWEPPNRLALAWRITPEWRYDPALLTTVEVRFVAIDAAETRVEFEHRDLEALGATDAAQTMRDSMEGGWGGILESFQRLVGGEGT